MASYYTAHVLTCLQLYLLGYITRLQTRFNAGPTLIHSTTSKSIPFEDAINFNEEVSNNSQTQNNNDRNKTLKSIAKYAFTFVTIASVITALSPGPVNAVAAKAATESVEHLHVGQKIANYFRSFGIPDLAVLAIISAMPVVELRGAVPVGGETYMHHIHLNVVTILILQTKTNFLAFTSIKVWMGLPITSVLPVCVMGNMAPIIPLMFLLRNDKLK